MEVQAGTVVCEAVCDVDFDSVAPVGLDCGTRNAAINSEYIASISVWRGSDVRQFEPVFDSDASVRHNVIIVCANVVVAPDATIARRVSRAYIAFSEAIDLEWGNTGVI